MPAGVRRRAALLDLGDALILNRKQAIGDLAGFRGETKDSHCSDGLEAVSKASVLHTVDQVECLVESEIGLDVLMDPRCLVREMLASSVGVQSERSTTRGDE